MTHGEMEERMARLLEEAKRVTCPDDRARLEAQVDFLLSAPVSAKCQMRALAALNRRLSEVVRRLEALAAVDEEERAA